MTMTPRHDGSDARRQKVLALLPGVLPAAAAGAVYLNALNNPFVWDDFRVVVDNPSIASLGNYHALFFHDVSRPLTNLSFAVGRAVWGPNPFGFHLVSILFHVLNVWLLFLFVRGALRDWQSADPADAVRIRTNPELAAAAAAWLFALHPMMTEAVGYISARADLLSAAFTLLALLCTRRWWLGASQAWLAASIGSWICAVASKETAIVYPLLLLAYDRCVAGRRAPAGRALCKVYLPLCAVMTAAALLRLALLLTIESGGGIRIHWSLILVDLDVIRRYFLLVVSPAGLTPIHAVASIDGILSLRALGALLFCAGLVGAALALRRVSGPASLGLWWFVLPLLPAAILVLLDLGHPMAEHRAYLSASGIFMAAGAAIAQLSPRRTGTAGRIRRVRTLVMGAGLLTLAGTTIVRNVIWSDPRVLWLDAVQKAPDLWLPHLLLGETLHARGLREPAVAAYARAIELEPRHPDTYLKLGVCLAEMNRLDEAAAVFATLRRVVPDSPVSAEGLGTVAMLRGRRDEARGHFLDALAVDPQNVAARQSLAILSEEERRPDDALRYCEEIRALAPETPGNDACIQRNRSRAGGAP
jgi:protein O-mannosyl-transferase